MATLSDKAETIRAQLGFELGMPIVDIINQACKECNLADELEDQTLVAKAEACLQILGGSQTPAVAPEMGIPIAPEMVIAEPVDAWDRVQELESQLAEERARREA